MPMPALVPNRFLVRIAHSCPYVKEMPGDTDGAGDSLLDLPEPARLENFAALDGDKNFAEVRLAWNELGIGLQVLVSGKEKDPDGDAEKPTGSDGITLWIDTRDARSSHRASRFCHQFHFLPVGGGPEKDEPAIVQSKINRALQDAPICDTSAIPFRCIRQKRGYRLEAFLTATVLAGYDPEQHPRLGIFYHVRDTELGGQFLGVNSDFPITEDPSLWEVLELRGL